MSDDGATSPRSRKPRLQSGQACSNCRKKKHRCDGERPKCSGCRSRRITCDYPLESIQQLSVRELEALVEASRRQSNNDAPSATERLDSASSTVPPGQRPNASNPIAASEPNGFFGDSSTFNLLSNIHSNDGDHLSAKSRPPATEWTEQSGSAINRNSSRYRFPTRDFADELVDAYFEQVHIL